jgi:thiol-disulfide isomerase/thioredoxin
MKIHLMLLMSLFFSLAAAQDIPSMDVGELKEYIYQDNATTYVVNFWATWCAPCVKEMPYFEALNAKYDEEELQVILVSLDFDNALEKRLIPFVKARDIQSEVIHLADERSPNYWIPEISEKWSGSIPATLILNGKAGVEAFYEQSFHSLKELDDLCRDLVR